MAKKSTIEKVNLIIAIFAIVLSGLSFWFSYYTYSKSKEERVAILATPLIDNFKTKVYSVGELAIIPLYWEITLSNNSDKNISIVNINAEAKDGVQPWIYYSNLYDGIFLDYEKSADLPINLNSGESKRFLIRLGVLCDSLPSKIILSNLKPSYSYDSNSKDWVWSRRSILIKLLAEKYLDFYSNHAVGNFNGEEIRSYQVNPKKQQIFTVTFTSSTNSQYKKQVSLYMKE